MSTGLFELGALRVRALRADAYAVADLLPENAFIDMSFRIGKGRSELEKRNTGEAIFSTVTRTLAALFDSPTLRCRSKSERSIWISAGRRTPSIRGCGDEQTGDLVANGGRVIAGGHRHRLGGRFYEATVLADITPAMTIAREETFGPVAPFSVSRTRRTLSFRPTTPSSVSPLISTPMILPASSGARKPWNTAWSVSTLV